MTISRTRMGVTAVVTVATLFALAACSTAEEDAPSTEGLTIGSIDLAAAGCPTDIVIQTDWNPEAEHGHLYEMISGDYTVDADLKTAKGPLMAGGEYTGVNLEVRAGGPAIGYQTVTAQQYTDDSITLGYANTDEAIQLSADMPTTAVFAPMDINPQMIMWDPATYPDVTTIAELADEGAIIKYFGGAAYMEYLVGAGVVPLASADGSYDGTPGNFVAQDGKDAQQGFASAEPYIYENEIADWSKPVDYQLIHDAGYPIYASAVSIRTGDLEEMSGCLTELVPVLQQAEVDYFASPATTNEMVLDLVDQYDNGWAYSAGVADYSVETMQEIGLVGNGTNDTMGDFDAERVAKVFDLILPVFESLDIVPADGLTPEDLYTNEFIDESIKF